MGHGLLIREVFLDHIQRLTTVGRTPLDEWSARRRDLYLTTHNTHYRQTSMTAGGVRTHNLSRRAAADLRLRPGGHWYRHFHSPASRDYSHCLILLCFLRHFVYNCLLCFYLFFLVLCFLHFVHLSNISAAFFLPHTSSFVFSCCLHLSNLSSISF